MFFIETYFKILSAKDLFYGCPGSMDTSLKSGIGYNNRM